MSEVESGTCATAARRLVFRDGCDCNDGRLALEGVHPRYLTEQGRAPRHQVIVGVYTARTAYGVACVLVGFSYVIRSFNTNLHCLCDPRAVRYRFPPLPACRFPASLPQPQVLGFPLQ